MTGEPAPAAQRPPARLGRRVVLVAALVALLLVLAGAALTVFRYRPALDDVRALRADLETMVDRVRTADVEIDRATIDALDANLGSALERLDRVEGLLANDPLVALGRLFPPTAPTVVGADRVVEAAGDLMGAVGDGLFIGRRFVEIREAEATDRAGVSVLARLVELMATSRERASSAAASVASARRALDAVPEGALAQVVGVRDAMAERIDTYGPLLDAYVDASDRLPSILGWDAPRRYLVLTQDPAEIRPTGGFTGSYGIVAIDRGRIMERSFQDVAPLDFPWDYPRIEPPRALADYLLGPKQPWQFADANWSPDYPTSARDALRLYANQTGDGRFDGVAVAGIRLPPLRPSDGDPVAVAVWLLDALAAQQPDSFRLDTLGLFRRLGVRIDPGHTGVCNAIDCDDWRSFRWEDQVNRFRRRARPYLLYQR